MHFCGREVDFTHIDQFASGAQMTAGARCQWDELCAGFRRWGGDEGGVNDGGGGGGGGGRMGCKLTYEVFATEISLTSRRALCMAAPRLFVSITNSPPD